MADVQTINAVFKKKRETKGTHLYEEIDSNGNPTKVVAGQIYIQKGAFRDILPPETISVAITFPK